MARYSDSASPDEAVLIETDDFALVYDRRNRAFHKKLWNSSTKSWTTKVAPYSAIVCKDGSAVWAEDASGKTIASGEAGVDDASVIQSALDRSGLIHLSAGEFIAWNLKLKSYTILRGEGIGRTIIKAPKVSTNGAVISVEDNIQYTKIEDLTIDGNRAEQSDISFLEVLHFSGANCRNHVVNNVELKGAFGAGDGIDIDEASNILVSNCFAHDNAGNGFHPSIGCKNVFLVNCVAYNNDYCGFELYREPPSESVQLLNCLAYGNKDGFVIQGSYHALINCVSRENARWGFLLSGEGDTSVAEFLLINCQSIGDGNHGFYIIYNADKCTLINCRAVNPGGSGFYAVSGDKLSLIGCRVEAPGDHAIRLDSTAPNGIISHCIVEGESDYDSILIYANNVRVIGCSVFGGKRGIYLHGNDGCAEHCFVTGCYTGFMIYGDRNVLSHCYAIDNSSIGIQFFVGTANKAIYGKVSGNPKNIEDTATDTVIRRMEGYLTENSGAATFSGDGATTQFSIAHGLVKAPSKVLVTPMTADAAPDFYVTADDTYIYINYLTAPASGTDNLKFSWYAEV